MVFGDIVFKQYGPHWVLSQITEESHPHKLLFLEQKEQTAFGFHLRQEVPPSSNLVTSALTMLQLVID